MVNFRVKYEGNADEIGFMNVSAVNKWNAADLARATGYVAGIIDIVPVA